MDLNVLALIKGRKERKRERREKGRNQSKDVSVRWTVSCLRKICIIMNIMYAHNSASDVTIMIISVPTSQMPEIPAVSPGGAHYFLLESHSFSL